MNLSLLVPGALPPESICAQLLQAVDVPRFAERLASAPRAHQAVVNIEAPHWTWLAQAFGLPAGAPATAPYVWADGTRNSTLAPGTWVAHCEVVHLVLARDHLVPTGLGDAPLVEKESLELLSCAREALQGSRFDLAVQSGAWFLVAKDGFQPDLHCLPLDAVLGRSLQERTPTGADARTWRRLENEIQMQWHRSATNTAREERGVRTANAIWIHGGGTRQALAQAPFASWRVDEGGREGRILQGWTNAAPQADRGIGRVLAVSRALLPAFQSQAWESWVGALPVVQARVEQELQEAARQGSDHLELVLTGLHSARSFSIPVRKRRWPWHGRRDVPGALRENLAESDSTETAPQQRA